MWSHLEAHLFDIAKTGTMIFNNEDRNTIVKLDKLTENYRSELSKQDLDSIRPGDVRYVITEDQQNQIHSMPEFQKIVFKLRRIRLASVSTYKDANYRLRYRKQISSSELHSYNPWIRYVYLVVPIPESPDRSVVKFIADVDPVAVDLDHNGKIDPYEKGTPVGLIYNIEDQPGLMKAFDGSLEKSNAYFQDIWGIWYSVYVPIFDSDGNVVAVMGIDVSAEKDHSMTEELQRKIIVVSIAGILISIFIGVIAGLITGKPIKKLLQNLGSDQSGFSGHSDLDTVIESLKEQKRELNQLSTVLKKDAIKIMNRVQARIEESRKIVNDPELRILFDVFTGRQEHKRVVECKFKGLPVRGFFEERQLSKHDRRRIFVSGVPRDTDSLPTNLALTVFFYLVDLNSDTTSHIILENLNNAMNLIRKEVNADIDLICGVYDPATKTIGIAREKQGQVQYDQISSNEPITINLDENQYCVLAVSDRAIDNPEGFSEVEKLLSRGDYLNALNFIDSGDNWSPPAYFHRAQAYIGLGNYANALKDLSVVTRFFEALEHTIYPVCNVLKRIGNPELSNRLNSASNAVQKAGRKNEDRRVS